MEETIQNNFKENNTADKDSRLFARITKNLCHAEQSEVSLKLLHYTK